MEKKINLGLFIISVSFILIAFINIKNNETFTGTLFSMASIILFISSFLFNKKK